MANNPITDEQLAELNRWLDIANQPYHAKRKAAKTHAQYMVTQLVPALLQRLLDAESRLAEVERLRAVVNDMGDLMADVRKQRDAATVRAEAAEKEALDYIDYRNQAVISRNAMERRLEAAEALVAGLRGALEEAGDVIHACFCETEEIRGKVCHPSCTAINAALALTPASAGNRIKAEALREAVEEVRHDVAAQESASSTRWALLCIADCLTAEAEKEVKG